MNGAWSEDLGEDPWGSDPRPPEPPCGCFPVTCTTTCDCTIDCTGDCTTACTDPLGRAGGDGTIDTIRLVGIRGGAGTSTIAGVLAMHAAGMVQTQLVATDPQMACALLGFAEPGGLPAEVAPKLVVTDRCQRSEGLTVIDEGALDPDRERPGSRPGERSLGVLRGPCYLALRTLMAAPHNLDGLVLVAEFGRALTERDVADVTGLDVVATVAGTPSVARTIDSGLLAARYRNLPDFRPLRRWLTLQLDPFPARRTDPRRTAPNHPSMSGTDLPLPPDGESGWVDTTILATASELRRKPVMRSAPVGMLWTADAAIDHPWEKAPACRTRPIAATRKCGTLVLNTLIEANPGLRGQETYAKYVLRVCLTDADSCRTIRLLRSQRAGRP